VFECSSVRACTSPASSLDNNCVSGSPHSSSFILIHANKVSETFLSDEVATREHAVLHTSLESKLGNTVCVGLYAIV